MKRNIILLFSIYCSIMAYAQKEYDSFLKEGKVWRMEYKQVVYEGESYQDKIIMLSGDTLIDDIPFRRMLEKRWMRGIQDEPKDWKATYGYIGEKDGKVYYWHNSYPTTPQIVMDFSLNEGDNVVGSTGVVYVVKAVSDTILSRSDDKRTRRCISVSIKDGEDLDRYSDTWIEGIGSIKGGITGIEGTFVAGAFPKLLLCEDNDICIYNTEDDLRSAIHHGLNNKNGDTYFQLNGLPVIRSSHGIYVKDGKKVVR